MSKERPYVVLTPRMVLGMRHAIQAMLAGPTGDGGDFTAADGDNGELALGWLHSLPAHPVVVVLTPAEADELSCAVGNSLHSPDDWGDFLGSKARLARAQSGQHKLRVSIAATAQKRAAHAKKS